MKERGIIFSGDNPKLILSGAKTQTRRLVKPQPSDEWLPKVGRYHPTKIDRDGEAYPGEEVFGASDENEGRVCPYGVAGDQIWGRETWGIEQCGSRVSLKQEAWPEGWPTDRLQYFADDPPELYRWNKRPSIHMPRWASRITLEIIKVRVERLQDITPADAEAEGIRRDLGSGMKRYDENMIYEYEKLWDSLHGAGSWALNPWVWCISFRKL